jgi:hypothetical protein
MSTEPSVLVATDAGLVVLSPDGDVTDRELAGEQVLSVAVAGPWWFVAVEGRGVLRRRERESWQPLGLEDAVLWTVAGQADGTAYAGVEPAGVWCLGDGVPRELSGLATVEGYDDWESPWGPADLGSIQVDGDRLIVGIEIGGVAVSDDVGESWQARNDGLFEDVHRVVADGDEMYATTGLGPHRSLDGGRTWTWEADGIDRGYTQGLAVVPGWVLVAASSGPPSLWGPAGPEAAIFRAARAPGPLRWRVVLEGFAGNVDRQALAARGSLVVAATSAGELLVSRDAGQTWSGHEGLAGAHAVALG